MSFWNEPTVERSWSLLLSLKKEHEFILIGGWAVWLYTRALKSKDIDIIVDHRTLASMMQSMPVKKNDHLRKYEFEYLGIKDLREVKRKRSALLDGIAAAMKSTATSAGS